MKKITLIILIILLSFSVSWALSLDEAGQYVGKYCYIKYNPYKYSNIDLNKKILGKIIGLINDEGYQFIVLGSEGLVYIPIEKIKDIQAIGE